MPDLSLILNLHDETRYLARTLHSCEEAVHFAAARGISTELVIVLDRPATETREWMTQYRADCFTAMRTVEVDNGSAGPSRAAGVAAAQGEYVTMADGDDLISFNAIAGMMETARSAGPDAIVMPEYVVEFGARSYVICYYGHPVVGALQTLFSHPFKSRLLMRRDRFTAIPCLDVPLGPGYAFEDWHFNSEALAQGMRFLTAPNTILYYRRRASSLSAGSQAISVGQIPPTRLAVPETLLPLLADEYAAWTQGSAAQRYAQLLAQSERRIRHFITTPLYLELVSATNRIDPAVRPAKPASVQTWTNLNESPRPGLAYYRLCQIVGARRFTDVFLLPFMARGGGEKYLLNVMSGLAEIQPDTAILVLTGVRVSEHAWLDRLPPGSVFVDLWQLQPDGSESDIELLTLKAIQAVAPGARIHLKHCAYTFRFWNRFARVLADSNRGIWYRFLDVAYEDDGRHFVDGYEFDFLSNNIDTFSLLVADNRQIIRLDHQRLGYRHELWQWLPTECLPASSAERVRRRAAGWRGRLLWASRLDTQKRPQLLPLLAAALHRRGIRATIDVFGSPLLQGFDTSNLLCDGLRYCGDYDAFEELDHDAYDGFLYTAAFDGLPNVVLEALGAGLPVVAPDIGGIAEVVLPGETGWLVSPYGSQPALVNGFCDAIVELYEDAERQRRMSLAAVQLIVSRHGRQAFLRRLDEVFGDAAEVPAANPASFPRSHAGGPPQRAAQDGVTPPARACPAGSGLGDGVPIASQQAAIDRLLREQQQDRQQLLSYAETVMALQPPRSEAPALSADVAPADARVATLATELARAQAWRDEIERSDFYRLLRAYIALNENPVLGPVLGSVRGIAARLMRRRRRRRRRHG